MKLRAQVRGGWRAVALLGVGVTLWLSGEEGLRHVPLADRLPAAGRTLFHRVPSSRSGLDFRLQFPQKAPFDLLTDQTSGTGVAIGDVDGDQRPDLFFTTYNQGNRLYRNLGSWKFEDITQEAGVAGEGRWCGGANFVDIDNDGDLDLYVCVYGASNLLYVNRGKGVFDERARSHGLDFVGASVMMSFADYDRDGDLDGYLVTHRRKRRPLHLLPKSTQEAVGRGILKIDSKARRAEVAEPYQEYFQLMDKGNGRLELVIAGERDRLFQNDGEGRFKEVSDAAGIVGFEIGLAASWWDYNNDAWPDLYVSNDYKGGDRLYRNNQDGTFTETTRRVLPHTPWFSMGSDRADINNDGLIDFLASDMSGRDHLSQKMGMGEMGKNRWFLERADPRQYMRNALYLNTGGERMFEIAHQAGLANTDWTWSPKFGDLDMDGYVDLFVSNGMSRDFMNSDLAAAIESRDDAMWRQTPVLKQANFAFRNRGDLTFEPVATHWGLGLMAASYGAALSDLDRDGDLDLVVANFNDEASLYQNLSATGQALLVQLVGRSSNRWGIGAKVTVLLDQGEQLTRVLRSAQGFMSSNEPLLHFGIPTGTQIERVRVEWPSGIVQRLEEVVADQWWVIREPDSGGVDGPGAPSSEPWFAETPRPFQWDHRERFYDDYQKQPLLPGKQSQAGPGVAVADVDGDGDEDLFVGGAAGQGGVLWVQREGAWKPIESPFAVDSMSEDMGVVFFDADGDRDLDLYVVSGGVEAAVGSRLYRDRLYLNQGSLRFQRAPEGSLPLKFLSGSCVVAGDYDRDGDLDLFVGGRTIPGQYPLAAPNQLLRNDGGRFVDVSETVPGLGDSGIVTSALWTDPDGDGWLDLMVAHHWGAIALFGNRQGRLGDVSERVGLSGRRGWWNGISGTDWDQDGDMDYLVSNLGRNTKYHGNPEHPSVIYYGDVDGSGVSRIVEAKFEGEIVYPERGKSCSTAAIPSLNSKFKSFKRFAMASLPEIYSPRQLQQALRLEVNHLDSVLLRNDSGRFRMESLPALIQVAPGFGWGVGDFNLDGWDDAFLAQNDFSPQPETGRMDGGMSLVLAGAKGGALRTVWPDASGVKIGGDAKSVAVVDLNADGIPDLVVTQNSGALRCLTNQFDEDSQSLIRIRLKGPPGNPTGIGSRIRLKQGGGRIRTREIYGGSGYLGQSSATVVFALHEPITEGNGIEVRWHDGRLSQVKVPAVGSHRIEVPYPGKWPSR